MERADTGPSGPAREYRGRSMPIVVMVFLAILGAIGLAFVWPW